MTVEEWRDIPGLNGHYRVSSMGRVVSVARKDRRGHRRPELILKPSVSHKGYLMLFFEKTNYSIHRLVALTFLGAPPEGRQQVNHKNGIKTDNRVCNLEWVSASENQKHRYCVLGHRGAFAGLFGYEHPRGKEVVGVSLADGSTIRFGSASEAQRFVSGSPNGGATVSQAARGLRKSYKGYRWHYADAERGSE